MAGLRKSFFIKARDFVHAGEASIRVQSLLKSIPIDPDRLVLEVTDPGPGIADVERAMQPGFSTASDELHEMGFGAGMGLPNMKNNADEILIESRIGQGTRVRMTFHIQEEGKNT